MSDIPTRDPATPPQERPFWLPRPPADVLAEDEATTVDVLHDPPSTLVEDPDATLAAVSAPASRAARTTTRVLALVLVLAVGFLGGAWWSTRSGGAATAARGFSPPIGASGGFGPQGLAPAGAGTTGETGATSGGTTTSGTVKLVDGSVVYVATAGGGVVRVTTSGTTAVLSTGTLSRLKAGDSVTVAGSRSTDGSLAASTITEGTAK